ncbi:hypothetical protein IWW48_004163 [Coemansia sp. RSA 1200]|nr:hypothetical protein IWW48_004163 [Coemansia sp. RSA 1200]
MASNVDIDIERLKEVCGRIVREGDLDSLTDRDIRRHAEREFGLEEKALDEKPYKKIIKETVSAVLEKLMQENEAKSEGEATHQQGEDAEDSCADKNETEDDENVADASLSDKDDHEDEDSHAVGGSDNETSSHSKRKPTETHSLSKPKRTKMSSNADKSVSAGSKKTIDNLKSYINKCGLRKVWSKELAGMNGTQQMRHLKKVLDDLGMEGRPTLEKCKKIKAKRELQAELAAMDQDNIIDGSEETPEQEVISRNRRGAARKKISYNVDQISDSEESDTNDEDDGEEDSEGEENGSADEVEESGSESDAYIEDRDSDRPNSNDNVSSDEEPTNNMNESNSD